MPVTVADQVAAGGAGEVTSAVVEAVTGSLNTTVKMIGEPLVGSAWPAAWSIVTVGATLSKVTVLSVLVEAVLVLPAASVGGAGRDAGDDGAVAGHAADGDRVGRAARR